MCLDSNPVSDGSNSLCSIWVRECGVESEKMRSSVFGMCERVITTMETGRTLSWSRRELFQTPTSPVKGKNSARVHVRKLLNSEHVRDMYTPDASILTTKIKMSLSSPQLVQAYHISIYVQWYTSVICISSCKDLKPALQILCQTTLSCSTLSSSFFLATNSSFSLACISHCALQSCWMFCTYKLKLYTRNGNTS